MSQRFYCLNGVDDVNLKQVFLNSFPESLGNKAYRALEARNVTIAQTTLGELYQLILNALAKLCNQKKFLAEFERMRKHIGKSCDDKYLIHFAKNCPKKKKSQALIQDLNQLEQVDISDLESLYYLDDEPGDSVLCTIAYSDLSFDDDSDTYSLDSYSNFGVHMMNPIPHILPVQEDPPLLLAKIHLLTYAYTKPIPVIAFFDIGSSVSILNPNILPDHYWKPHHQNFMATNGEKFVIEKISVPINIRLFPKIFFNPLTAMHRLFITSITQPIFNINSIKQRLIQTSCASSHTEFLTKHPSPLLLNLSFFVSFPFKQNEDVNRTKASYPGMNLDHYQQNEDVNPTKASYPGINLSPKASLNQPLPHGRAKLSMSTREANKFMEN
ncbi:hypothetical protein Tco_1370408 [Tanacetum coccineum]